MPSKLYDLFQSLEWKMGGWQYGKGIEWAATTDSPLPLEASIGVDVGTANLGIAVTFDRTAYLYQYRITRSANVCDRLEAVKEVVYDITWNIPFDIQRAVIEGADFTSVYRQVELAEQRAFFVTEFVRLGIVPVIVPPSTIRKGVLGKGNEVPQRFLGWEKKTYKKLRADALNALIISQYKD